MYSVLEVTGLRPSVPMYTTGRVAETCAAPGFGLGTVPVSGSSEHDEMNNASIRAENVLNFISVGCVRGEGLGVNHRRPSSL